MREIGTEYMLAVSTTIGEQETIAAIMGSLGACGFDGATVIASHGLWKGAQESGYVIFVATIAPVRDIKILARILRHKLEQEAVYVSWDGVGRLV